jgi:hypothetical protein
MDAMRIANEKDQDVAMAFYKVENNVMMEMDTILMIAPINANLQDVAMDIQDKDLNNATMETRRILTGEYMENFLEFSYLFLFVEH